MSEVQEDTQQSSLNAGDILFILFRHKWKILICALAGIAAAAAVYFTRPPLYQSEAKLLVRYVVERSAIDAVDSGGKAPGSQGINSEVEILTSWDLALQVAETIGVDRLVHGPDATQAAAAYSILRNLEVSAVKETNIISVIYTNSDPDLAVQVLQEIVKRYFDKHLEVHRSVGAFEFVSRETEQLRKQLSETEEELKQLQAKAGITSLAETTASLNAKIAKAEEELDTAQSQAAAQQARVQAIEKALAISDVTTPSDGGARQASTQVIHDYQALLDRVARLRQNQTELLSRYTPENRMVKINEGQIDQLEAQRRDMERKYPALLATVSGDSSGQAPRPDLTSERARLAAIKAEADTFKTRLDRLRAQAKVLADLGPQIGELERRKEVEDNNYKYFEASLEKARVDETLDPTRMPNISVVQRPSAALKTTRDIKKVVLGLAGGGLALGIGLALLIELVLDRTVKRPLELETRLRMPLLLTIPYFGRNGNLRLPSHKAVAEAETALQESAGPNVAPWESTHFIRPFCEAIRDHLVVYFELNKVSHKPKLVGVTGLSKGAGASTVAAGLAATLSEMCDGRVLLVDKQFDAKRFYDLLAEFKTSNFDYVIFDMPSLGNTTSSLATAVFMDKILLVVEAEKTTRDVVKRAYAQLATRAARVSMVLNKSRSYGPKWLANDI